MKRHLLLFALLLLISGAMFGQESYLIEVSANPSNGGTVTGGGSFPADTTITITATPNSGYQFIKWMTGDGIEIQEPEHSFTVTQDSTFVAYFALNQNSYTLSINYKYTDGTQAAPTYTDNVNYGAPYSVASPTITGYTPDIATVSGTMPDHDVTVDVTYGINSYTLTINYKYADGTQAAPTHTEDVNYGASYNVTSPSIIGYTPDIATVSGTMPDHDVTVDVTYNINTYTISVSASPSNGGTVAGGGTYQQGQQCTVTASANSGYTFTNWTENGEVVSEHASYNFQVTSNRTLVANFVRQYTITANPNNNNYGTVSGGGLYDAGATCNLRAEPRQNYQFNNWTENGEVVSSNANYSFPVERDRVLVANFSVLPPNNYSINVSANPSQGGTVTGGGTYQQGQQCTVTATAAAGYNFLRWTENGNTVSENPIYQFTVTGNRTLVAQFQLINYNINVSADPTNGGSVTGGGAFHYNDTITVSATANAGFSFTNWTENGTVVSAQASYQFTVTSDRNLVAHFTAQAPNTYTVTVAANPTNGGAPYIGNTPGTTQASFTSGQSCTVHANPANGYNFIKWTENGAQVSTNANYTFTVTSNRNLVAHYQAQAQTYTVSVSANSTNGGAPYIGNTPGSTQATFTSGQQCTVHANPNQGYTFLRWTENGTQVSANANYTFTVTSNRNLVAHYQAQPQTYTITVSANPTDGGSVSGGGTYNQGTSCMVKANPNSGFSFTNWTENGNVVSSDAEYTFIVNSNRTLVANFTQQHTVAVSTNPSNGGSVSGGGIYNHGASCTVIATAGGDYTFFNWTENGNQVSDQANYTFIVNSDHTLVANFRPLPPNTYNINVSPNPSDGGTVTGGGTYTHGQQCTVKATANPGYTFKKWTENGNLVSTEANYRFNVTGSRTLVAQFQQQNYTITASADPVNGGTVTGDGTYAYGVTCILTATPNEGYTFEHWKKGNTIVSTEFVHSFEVTENASFTANFKPIHQYSITATAEPEEGGTVTGYGTYAYGITCILTATPNEGYTFEHWKKGNTIVSTELVHSFEVTENASFIANFKPILVPHYTISVSANPTDWGEVYIGDSIGTTESTFAQGKYCTVHAEANDGYTFINWTENDSVVSNDKDFQFKVTSNRKLIANFKEIPCIELKDIEAKKHKTQYNDMVVLILVYPEAGYKYQWLRSDEENGDYTEIPGVTGQYYYKKGGIEEGYYKVRITKGECELVTEKPYKVQYPLKQLRIYPNPSRRDHNIVVVNDSDSPSQLSIYSTDGRLLHTQTVTDSQTTLNLNLPSGVYIAYLTDSDGYTKIGKLVIQ